MQFRKTYGKIKENLGGYVMGTEVILDGVVLNDLTDILQDGTFEVMCELYDELKKFCNNLNLSTAQDVRNFLEKDTYEESRKRSELEDLLNDVKADNSIMSRIVSIESEESIRNLFKKCFIEKVQRIKRALYRKGIDFFALPLDKKLEEFKKTLMFENDDMKELYIENFIGFYSRFEESKDKQSGEQNDSSAPKKRRTEDGTHSHHNTFPEDERVRDHFPLCPEL